MKSLPLLLFCILSTSVLAQKLDYDTIIPSEKTISSFEEYLVAIAWQNHPTGSILESRAIIANEEIAEKRLGYLEGFSPFLNYSRGTTDGLSIPNNPNNPENPTVLSDGTNNAFSVGLSIRLLPFFTTKHQVKAAQENLKIAELEVNSGKLSIKNKVLTLYRSFLMTQDVLEQRQKIVEEAEENYRFVLELFQKGGAEFEDVTSINITRDKAIEDRLRAEIDSERLKLALEEWIGVTIEEAMAGYGSFETN